MPGFFPCREICGCGRRKKHWPVHSDSLGRLWNRQLACSCLGGGLRGLWSKSDSFQGLIEDFCHPFLPLGRSLHLLFEELRQGGDLTGHDGSKTASDLVHDQNPTNRKKIQGERWRQLAATSSGKSTAPCDVPNPRQGYRAGEGCGNECRRRIILKKSRQE